MTGRLRDDLDEDYQLQFAVQKGIENIGEAAGGLSAAIKSEIADVPWAAVIGMRHHLVHGYNRVDLDVVWRVVERDIPALITAIAPYIDRLDPDPGA